MRKIIRMEESPNLSGDDESVKSDLDLLRKDMAHEFESVRKDMAYEFDSVRKDMTHEFQLVRKDLELGIKGFEALVAKSNQKMMIQLIGVFALINGMLFAGVKWV
jgi:hypothetical protein